MILVLFTAQIVVDGWLEISSSHNLLDSFPNLLVFLPLTLGIINRETISHLQPRNRPKMIRPFSLHHALASIHQSASTMDFKETLTRLAKTATDLLRAEFCAIEYGSSSQAARVAWQKAHCLGAANPDEIADLLFSQSSGRKTANVSKSKASNGNKPDFLENLGLYSMIEEQIVWQGRTRGTIVVASSKLAPFGSSSRRILSLFSQQAAVVLHNCEANNALRKQAIEAEALFRITKTLNSNLPLKDILKESLRSLLELLNQPIGVILLHDVEKLRCISSIGLTEDQEMEYISADDTGIAGVCFSEKRPVAASQVENDPRFSRHSREPFASKSALAAPLLMENKAVGVLVIASSEANRSFSSEEVRIVMMVANQMAGAIERLGLLDQIEKRAKSLNSLLDAARTISSNLEMRDVLPTISRAAVELLAADASCIMLLEADTGLLTLRSGTNLSPDFIERSKIAWGDPVAGWVAAQGEPVIIHDIALETEIPPYQRDVHHQEGLVNYLGVPLRTKGVTVGVLSIFSKNDTKHFTESDVELLTILANQAAVAIENARLFRNEEETISKLRQLARHRIELANMMSHELRTPLTSIKGFAQLLSRKPATDPSLVEKYAGIVYSESSKMVDTINDILDLSNMERGLIELQREPINIGNILRESINSARLAFSNCQFRLKMPEYLPTVRSDADKIRHVMASLIGLTARYNSFEKSEIRVEAHTNAGDRTIVVSVGYLPSSSDPGPIGTLLKDPIGFGNSEPAMQFRSGALSLYKCQNYIQAHGGELWLENDEFVGARFCFQLRY